MPGVSRIDQWKYEKAYSTLPNYRMGSGRYRLVQEDIAGMTRGLRYLDVGCGRAETLHMARQGGLDAWGTDIVAELTVDPNILDADIEALPFQDGEFDYVSCYDVLEHLEPGTEQQALDELGRVCSKHLFLSTNDKYSHLPSGEDLHINKRSRCAWQADIDARWADTARIFFKTFGHLGSEWHWRIEFD